MDVLPACLPVYHLHAWCLQKWALGSPELKFQVWAPACAVFSMCAEDLSSDPTSCLRNTLPNVLCLYPMAIYLVTSVDSCVP